jgi:alcohol dehydrogenase class IV
MIRGSQLQGFSNWSDLTDFFQRSDIHSVLLVTGRSSYTTSGAEAAITPILKDKRVRHTNDFETDPKAEDISRLVNTIKRDAPYELILAVGGGSVIDVAKLLKAFLGRVTSDRTTSDTDFVSAYLDGSQPLQPADIPLIAIPTTAGSGSEATHFAVVYQNQVKHSIGHQQLLPDLALIIPSLLTSLPQSIAAASGMDALCQAIESYWSIHSTDESRRLAKESIELAWNSLRQAVIEKEPTALAQLARASHLAGQAINITKTTAPHAVSYALTTFYGIPHGHAVGLLTPYFLKYNAAVTESDCLDSRGVARVKQAILEILEMLRCQTTEQAATAIRELMQDLGLETNFKNLGIQTEKDITQIIDNGFNPQRINNNPRRVTRETLYQVFC